MGCLSRFGGYLAKLKGKLKEIEVSREPHGGCYCAGLKCEVFWRA